LGSIDDSEHAAVGHHTATMLLCPDPQRFLVDAPADSTSQNSATTRAFAPAQSAETPREPAVRIRVERWIVELIKEIVESRKRSRVRAFVRKAILAYIDRGTDPP
jgi:hypothetical protein